MALTELAMMPQIRFSADAPGGAEDTRVVKSELQELKQSCVRDPEEFRDLKARVGQLGGENKQLKAISGQIQTQQHQTAQVVKQIQKQSKERPSPSQVCTAFSRYLGSDTFMITGAAGFSQIYAPQTGKTNEIPFRGRAHSFRTGSP